jgi:CheY-like chemotaxis protein
MAHERILIVEDEKITGMDIRQTVQEFGYEPIGPVASGEDAVTSALVQRPDVVLMDIALKGPMDGIQAAEVIRSQYLCPVIYVTAHSNLTTLDRAKVTEPSGWILKPVDEEELHTAIQRALYRHGMEHLTLFRLIGTTRDNARFQQAIPSAIDEEKGSVVEFKQSVGAAPAWPGSSALTGL